MMGPKDDQTPLGEQMEKIGGAFKKLGKQITDATKNEDSLKLAATIKAAATKGLEFEPEKKADIPVADQAKFVADFRAKLKEFIGVVDKLTAALQANDNAAAAKVLDEMKNERKEGHKAFEKEKPKKG